MSSSKSAVVDADASKTPLGVPSLAAADLGDTGVMGFILVYAQVDKPNPRKAS
jgi:hypothetical protein